MKDNLKQDHPLFSIIMPVYNADKYLKKTLDSILNQDFSDYELIIINQLSFLVCHIICYPWYRLGLIKIVTHLITLPYYYLICEFTCLVKSSASFSRVLACFSAASAVLMVEAFLSSIHLA